MTKLITPEGRVSFPHVFERSEYSDKYEMTLVFPEGTDLSELKEAAAAAAREKWGDKLPANIRTPFRKASEKEIYDEHFEPDDIFISFRSSNSRPGVVDSSLKPILDKADFYPGCWARVSANAYAYSHKGNKGVAFGLNNVLKVRDDDSFGGSNSKPEVDFEDFKTGDNATNTGSVDDIFGP